MPAGRPSDFTPEIADRICERLADGESLRQICASDGMPNRTTVWRWIGTNEEFRNQYNAARETQLDALADEIIALADESRLGIKTTTKGDGTIETVEGDMIERARLQVDSRKWILSKLAPKKYGDRIEMEHKGGMTITVDKRDESLT